MEGVPVSSRGLSVPLLENRTALQEDNMLYMQSLGSEDPSIGRGECT